MTNSRRDKLAACLQQESLDALLISSPVNVSYLTGFSGDSSCLVLGATKSILVSDGRFSEQIVEECPGLEVHIRPSEVPLPKAVAGVLESMGGRDVGFESSHLSVADLEGYRDLLPAVSWKGERDRVEKLRVIKDDSEVAAIREAIRIAEQAFAMFRANLRPEHTEKELSDAMEGYIRRAGGTCSSFPTIVAAGPRSALPHAPPTDRPVGDAGLILVDWGASGRFYKSDLTRVLVTRRNSALSCGQEKATGKLEEVHAVVRQAQEQAIRAVRPGVKAHDVNAAAREVIDRAGYGANFTHGLGHGLGMQVHEAPSVRTHSKDVIQEGMVFTIEPGIYLPGWGGIRLEDDVLVTADGCEVLTSVPLDLPSLVCDF